MSSGIHFNVNLKKVFITMTPVCATYQSSLRYGHSSWGSCSFLLLPKCDVTRSNPTRRVPIIKKYNGHHDKSIWFAPKVHFVKNVPRF